MFTPQSSYRSHLCGELRPSHIGQTVRLAGWINTIRRFRAIAFVELREASGLVQLVLTAEQARELTEESCIAITGVVRARSNPHPNIAAYPTGEIEVALHEFVHHAPAGSLPFAGNEEPGEEQIMRHKVLALRRPQISSPLIKRAKMVRAMRAVTEQFGFVEVETPVLVRATPGGAAPFCVPIAPGRGYALAQSPQIWKQLLVCGGLERYSQLAHCFRNETARPERQPEFSQFEIELAFSTAEEIQQIMQEVVTEGIRATGAAFAPFERMTYLQAMALFGSEKPNLANPLRLSSPIATPATRFEPGEVSLTLPQKPTREEECEWLTLAWQAIGEHGQINLSGQTIFASGSLEHAQKALGVLLHVIAQRWGLIKPGLFPVWVTNFPLWEEQNGAWVSAHHPFTRPLPGHEELFEHPSRQLSEGFDLVINGVEIGGGSMRIHEPHLQRRVFEFLGFEKASSEENFRPLLEALQLGAPPHGGMALGVERLVAMCLGHESIRSVMAFPKSISGQCPLTEALGPI